MIPIGQGIGFAVPSNTARWIVAEILEHGRVRRRQLGITATSCSLPRQLVRELDLLTDRPRPYQTNELIDLNPLNFSIVPFLYQPRYNILLRDDKTYPWICIKKEAFPRVFTTRKIQKDGSEYFAENGRVLSISKR